MKDAVSFSKVLDVQNKSSLLDFTFQFLAGSLICCFFQRCGTKARPKEVFKIPSLFFKNFLQFLTPVLVAPPKQWHCLESVTCLRTKVI